MEILDLHKDQNYFIACGWITNKERQLFQLFPHVLKIHVVKGTNNEDHSLLTVSIHTSQGKYVVICQMILLHERRISYCWVFSHSVPVFWLILQPSLVFSLAANRLCCSIFVICFLLPTINNL